MVFIESLVTFLLRFAYIPRVMIDFREVFGLHQGLS